MNAADLMTESLAAAAEAGWEIREPLFTRFFKAFPKRRAAFLVPQASSIRMTDETLQIMLGLAEGADWVWPQIADIVFTHRAYGPLPIAEYDAFIDMTVKELARAVGASWSAAHQQAWQTQADVLKQKIRDARREWAAGAFGNDV
ncbi:hypothetical protein KCG44_06740 [Pacificimonas sp. WHA3]|uniref:Globin n=1 Tax=Pacificimonas pallii TaxID=2827236 RepID=A0ABS6SDI7_9SPHN|nr:hypothetical protein [Pacificimonas pallii]MBV7256482.1 hypothetical protein [Pacificimonas pallii]